MFSAHFDIKLSKIGQMELELFKFQKLTHKKNTLYYTQELSREWGSMTSIWRFNFVTDYYLYSRCQRSWETRGSRY